MTAAGRRRRRTDRLGSAWLVAALVLSAIALVSRSVLPQPLWTLIHVVTLGVLTNAILQWSWYFARTLLHLPETDHRAGRDAAIRAVAFNVALVGLFAAMWAGLTVLTSLLAGVIGLIIAWHGLALLNAGRSQLASRFAVIVRFYVAASAFLVVGSALAGLITVAMLDPSAPDWLVAARDRLTVAHAVVNVAGWIGLSIAGTLVTLAPTMLRTRMQPQAVSASMWALPWLIAGVGFSAVAGLLGWMPGVGIGLLIYAAAVVPGVASPLVRTAITKGPRTYATWTMSAGLAWIVVSLVAVGLVAMTSPDAGAFRSRELPWVAVLGAGGVGQVFIAAMTYLLPVVVGGGPRALRVGMTVLESAWPLRVVTRNTAIALLAATAASATGLGVWWALVLVTYAIDVVLLAVAGRRQVRARIADMRAAATVQGGSRV